MDKIAMVKNRIHLQNWTDMEIARQSSGLTVTEWCRRENLSKSAYYYRLRKIRESICEQIPVPITTIDAEKERSDNTAIKITCCGMQIDVCGDIPEDKLTAIIKALKC